MKSYKMKSSDKPNENDIKNRPCIRFNKVNGFVEIYDGTIYLVLFGPEKYNAIYNRFVYPGSQKGVITYVISHNYGRGKFDSGESLLL